MRTSAPQNLAVCQNLVPLVNIKIAGKWMFIPLKMVLIGIDPYPFGTAHPSSVSEEKRSSAASVMASRCSGPWKLDEIATFSLISAYVHKYVWNPPMTHPWQQSSFFAFVFCFSFFLPCNGKAQNTLSLRVVFTISIFDI